MEFEIKEQEERKYIGIRKSVPVDKMAETVGPLYQKVYSYVLQNGGQINGGSLAVYHNEPSDAFDMECAVPLANELPAQGEIKPGALAAGKTAVATHVGAYDGLKQAREDFGKTAFQQGMEFGMPCWEEYIVGPDSEQDPSKWVTKLVCPVK